MHLIRPKLMESYTMLKYSRHAILKTSIISNWSIGSMSSILKVFLEIFKYIL